MKKKILIIGSTDSGKTALIEAIKNLTCSPDIIIVGEMGIGMHDLKTVDPKELPIKKRDTLKMFDPPMLSTTYIDDKPGHPFQKFIGQKTFTKKRHR